VGDVRDAMSVNLTETAKVLQDYTDRIKSVCESLDWKKDWGNGGCYLHLEASELIEALRGKGEPVSEAADVIIALFALTSHYDITADQILTQLDRIVLELEGRVQATQ